MSESRPRLSSLVSMASGHVSGDSRGVILAGGFPKWAGYGQKSPDFGVFSEIPKNHPRNYTESLQSQN